MNLKELENKTILLFGKSRAFTQDEFDAQMKYHDICVVKKYSQEVVLIVEGKMMTPYEQNLSDELYEQKCAEFITVDALELELAKHIDSNTLLMSLKLSHDKTRLKGFLQNTAISDGLFLRLLAMYEWRGEDFFDNDDNRDVSAAIIVRFYPNIERNHNVQYATLGLMHLIVQCRDDELIKSIAELEPLQRSLNESPNGVNYKILTAIATHHYTPKNVLRMLVKKSDTYIKTLIAMRSDCDEAMQNSLYMDASPMVLEALSYNTNLCEGLIAKLFEHETYAKNIAKYIRLDDAMFEMFIQTNALDLAQNISLDSHMQERLLSLAKEDVQLALAANTHLGEDVLSQLLCGGNQEIILALYANANTPQESLEEAYENDLNHIALSHNPNTPHAIFRLLFLSKDVKVLQGLAQNHSTPVDVLYQLQLDSRFERAVKENPAFGEHIQSANIGWQV